MLVQLLYDVNCQRLDFPVSSRGISSARHGRGVVAVAATGLSGRTIRRAGSSVTPAPVTAAGARHRCDQTPDCAGARSGLNAHIVEASTRFRVAERCSASEVGAALGRRSCGGTKTCNRWPHRARGRFRFRTDRSPSFATSPERTPPNESLDLTVILAAGRGFDAARRTPAANLIIEALRFEFAKLPGIKAYTVFSEELGIQTFPAGEAKTPERSTSNVQYPTLNAE